MIALFYKQTKVFDRLSRAKSKGGFLIISFRHILLAYCLLKEIHRG